MERKFHTLEQSKELIAPIYEEVINCVRSSFTDFIKLKDLLDQNLGYVEFQKRTKGCIIHDFITNKVSATFSDNPNVTIGTFNKVFGIVLKDALFLRFKKMDKDYKVSSFKTRQHKQFMHQHQIDGFPETPTFLFAGYIPNSTWTDLDGVYLACWNGDVLEWYDEAGNYSYEQTNLDFQQNAGAEIFEAKEDKLTLKEELRKKKETGTN